MRQAWFRHGFLVVVLAGVLLAAPARAQDANPVYSLRADGLACPFCAYGIEKQLSKIEGVEAVETDIGSGTVTITLREGASLSEENARNAVEKAGFTMRAFERQGGG